MLRMNKKLIATLGVGALVLGLATQALGSTTVTAHPNSAGNRAGVEILDRPGTRFARSIAVARYESAYAKARKAGDKPKRDLSKVAGVSNAKLKAEAKKLEAPAAPAVSSPESYGISQATLDSIAACESGGNPAAVSPDGTYRGKYQFDYGTWASMGGSGDPAAAPEAEQDMRAAMLYASAGSSPWPICG